MNRISPLCKHSARGDLGCSEFAAFVKIGDPGSIFETGCASFFFLKKITWKRRISEQ